MQGKSKKKFQKFKIEPYYFYYGTPIGTVRMEETDGKISGLYLDQKHHFSVEEKTDNYMETEIIREAHRQLEEYFAGRRKEFDLPLYVEGTLFQKKVWEVLRRIPYGETRSYGEIAAEIGNPKACRAVGGASHRNPVMIFIPCHRVIGADGSLTGFGGGIEAKEYMLKLEKRVASEEV